MTTDAPKANCSTAWEDGGPGESSLVAEIRLALKRIAELEAIVAKLPADADGNVYPPPNALQGNVFYHPDNVGPGTVLFSQLFWHSAGYWGIHSGGHEVPFSECYGTKQAAQAAKEA